MEAITGSISIEYQNQHYTLFMVEQGWLVAELLQFLDDIYRAEDPRIAILKQMGLAIHVSSETPPRSAHHWIELDLENHRLSTNSDLIRKAVKRRRPFRKDPYYPPVLERIYRVLDDLDFEVHLYK
jgi:hypothetical protein